MFEVFDVAENVIGCRMKGNISVEEYDDIVKKIEDKIAQLQGKKLRIYAEIIEPGIAPPEKFFENLKFKFKHVKDFEKEAVVSDNKLLTIFVDVVEKLFPTVEAKTFSFEEKDKALEWIKTAA